MFGCPTAINLPTKLSNHPLKIYSNFDGLSFGTKWILYWNWFFAMLQQRKFKAKNLLHLKDCSISTCFSHKRKISANCACWLLHVKLRTRTKGIEFPYRQIEFWTPRPLSLYWNASFESINLIKSDFITGNLNPCWMKFSWSRTSGTWIGYGEILNE